MRLRIVLVLTIAVTACAFSAALAHAAAGPLWGLCEPKEGGMWENNRCSAKGAFKQFEFQRLKKGQSLIITVQSNKNYVLANGVQTLNCTKQKDNEAAALEGSEEGTSGTSSQTIEFEGCTVEGNGTPCEPEKGIIKTEPTTSVLDFANEKSVKGEKVLETFKPTSGAVFTKIKFVGSGCKITEAAVEGSVAGTTQTESGAAVTVEENEELTSGEKEGFNSIEFPETKLKVEWTEKEGKREKVETSLKSFGKAATKFTGQTRIKEKRNGGNVVWGIRTKP
jgi:hypothetical protein